MVSINVIVIIFITITSSPSLPAILCCAVGTTVISTSQIFLDEQTQVSKKSSLSRVHCLEHDGAEMNPSWAAVCVPTLLTAQGCPWGIIVPTRRLHLLLSRSCKYPQNLSTEQSPRGSATPVPLSGPSTLASPEPASWSMLGNTDPKTLTDPTLLSHTWATHTSLSRASLPGIFQLSRASQHVTTSISTSPPTHSQLWLRPQGTGPANHT